MATTTLTANGSLSAQYFGTAAKITVGSDAAQNLGGGSITLKETQADGSVKTLKTYAVADDFEIPDILDSAQLLTLTLAGATSPSVFLALN